MEKRIISKKKEENGITLISMILLMITILLLTTSIIIVFIYRAKKINNTTIVDEKNSNSSYKILDSDNNFYIEKYKNNDYYISNGEYKGEYDIQILHIDRQKLENFDVNEVMSYSKYKEYCEKWKLKQKYNMTSSKYIVFSHSELGAVSLKVTFSGIEIHDKTATLYIWDEARGVTADTSEYVIVIPTDKDINSVDVKALYSKEQYNKIAGNNPLQGYSYSIEDNKEMASVCYINTTNSKLNEIVNKMLDAMVMKHTIQIDTDKEAWIDEPAITKLDLIESVDEYSSNGEISSYTTYTNENNTTYFIDGENMQSGRTRDYALFELFLGSELNFIISPDKYDIKINEEDIYYVIEAKSQEEKEHYEMYFINKETNLLEKTVVKSPYYNPTSIYTYTDEVIQIPKNLVKNSKKIISIDKPIIYLYPTEDTEVSVKLLKDENLTCSYPKYKDEWKVLAQSNGILKDLNTNRQLYSLYYESTSDIEFKVENEGFIIKGKETIAFLEEKLAILGLTEKEAEEFIVYWLPKLEANKYNYIRFATTDEINENMPLEINPNPDTIIRVLMIFKGLEKPIDIQEQKLETPNRTGFVAVEWGGTEID